MYLAIIKSIVAKVVTKFAGICLLFTAKEIISYILSYKKCSVWCKIELFCPLQWQIYNISKDWILKQIFRKGSRSDPPDPQWDLDPDQNPQKGFRSWIFRSFRTIL